MQQHPLENMVHHGQAADGQAGGAALGSGFVETLLRGAGSDLLLVVVVVVAPHSALVGASVAEVRNRFLGTATLLAIRRGNRVLAPLPNDLVIGAGDHWR